MAADRDPAVPQPFRQRRRAPRAQQVRRRELHDRRGRVEVAGAVCQRERLLPLAPLRHVADAGAGEEARPLRILVLELAPQEVAEQRMELECAAAALVE